MAINLLANEIEVMPAGDGVKYFLFCDLHALVNNSAGPFGKPTQVSTQVQLASPFLKN